MNARCLLIFLLFAAACNHERSESAVLPPLTVAPAAVASATSAPTATVAATEAPPTFEDQAPPVVARFVHLSSQPMAIEHVACEERIVAVATGTAKAAGESLAAGDVLITQGRGSFTLTGAGVAVFAIARGANCEPPIAPMTKRVVRGTVAPELTFAEGRMHAHLDVEAAVSPFAYVGRLEGDAPVAEHEHDGAWEVLAAVEGEGTFTLAGKPYRLKNEQIVVVPPGVKHAFLPSPGSHLRAVQLYSPPGSEQRFRVMAGAAPKAK